MEVNSTPRKTTVIGDLTDEQRREAHRLAAPFVKKLLDADPDVALGAVTVALAFALSHPRATYTKAQKLEVVGAAGSDAIQAQVVHINLGPDGGVA